MPGHWVRTSGSGTFEVGVDCPATVVNLWIRGIGGGGGGAGAKQLGSDIYFGGGGGAGGYFEDVLSTISTSSYAWEVGEGGAGMLFDIFGDAGDGFDTVFGAAVAGGGFGGSVDVGNVSGGAGGIATGASVLVEGGRGGLGFQGRDPDTLYDIYTGNGGCGAFGNGSSAGTGILLRGSPGGGGGGHVSLTSASSNDGNPGMIIVAWFAP